MKLRYRTVWISDTHLGTRGARAAELSQFLKRIRCQQLYLVGDILDMQALRHHWYWPPEHNEVFRRLLKMAKKGAEIIYMPGNHDDPARQYLFLAFGGLRFAPDAIHTTADGRKLLVIHGDQFDLVVQSSPRLAALGSWAYDWLIVLNRFYNRGRDRLGLPYSSLSQKIKLKVKSACQFISRFEQVVQHAAQRQGLNGVVCGHIHKAEMREQDPIQYYNCGDWVESCTALVEHMDGRMEIIDGLAAVATLEAAKAEKKRRKEAKAIAREAAAADLSGDSGAHPSLPEIPRNIPAAVLTLAGSLPLHAHR